MAEERKVIKEVVMETIIEAPREEVFKAWIDPEIMKVWSSPEGFTIPVCEVDPKPGGKIKLVMKGPDGKEYPNTGLFHEIFEPQKIVLSSYLEDENGNTVLEDLQTITLNEVGENTRVKIVAQVVDAIPEVQFALDGMDEGWAQTVKKLEEYYKNR